MPPKKRAPAKKPKAPAVRVQATVAGDARISVDPIPGLMLLDVTRFRTDTKGVTNYFYTPHELDVMMQVENNPEVWLRFSLSLSFSLYHSLTLYMDPPRCHFHDRANVSLTSCSHTVGHHSKCIICQPL
jgi:hypothetical protein